MNRLSFYDSNITIDFKSVSFAQNRAQWLTQFEFVLFSLSQLKSEFSFFRSRLLYQLGDQDYHLMVDDDGGQSNGRITARSLTVLLDAPYAERIEKRVFRNQLLSAIISTLCTESGLTLDFRVTDFLVSYYLAEQKTPIEIIKELANDARVSIQSSLDGLSLIVCYRWKELPINLPEATAKTLVRLFSNPFDLENIENFDVIVVKTDDNTAVIEQKNIVDFIRVRVFLSEFSATPPDLVAYGDNIETEYKGIKTEIKTADDVEIENGNGSIEKNATLVSHDYYGHDLGDVTLHADGNFTTAIEANGLVKIVYSVSCHEFYLRSPCCDKIRFDVFNGDVFEVRLHEGDRYADDLIVKHCLDRAAQHAAGIQVLLDLQDYESHDLKTDNWDDLPLPCEIVEFDDKRGYCDGFNVSVSDSAINATVTVKVPARV